MAGNNVALTFSLGATLSSSYKAAFSSASSAIKQVTNSIREMERTPVGKLGAQMAAQKEKIKSLAGELKGARAQLSSLQAQEGQAGTATGLLARQIQLAQRNVSNLEKALHRQREGFRTSAAEAANLTGSVKNLRTQYSALTATMERQKKTQAALVANQAKQQALQSKRGEMQGSLFGTMAVAAAAAAPAKLAIDFEASMAKVGALARASGEELQRMTDLARELGRDTQFSASQAAEGMQYLAMAGFDVNQTMAAMPGMLDLAAAADIDLGSAADIASNILSGFKLKAEDMGKVGDALAATFTSSNTDLNMLGESMKYVGPVAASVGMSMQDCAAAVGMLGNVGIQGSQAGTALRTALLRLSAPAKMAKDALGEMAGVSGEALDELYEQMEGFAGGEDAVREFGVSTKDAEGNMRPMVDILEELAIKTSNLGSAERAAAFKKIFGTEASSAMIALADAAVKTVDDSGNAIVNKAGKQTTALRQYMEEINQSEGTSARIAETMKSTVSGALKQMGSAWEDVGISVGNMFLPAIRAAANVMVSVANAISSFTQRFPNLSSAIAMAAGGLVAFRVATLAAGIASTFLGGGLTSMVGMVLRVASSHAVATAATTAYTAVTTAAQGAIGLLSGAFGVLRGAISLALGPIGLIITAIATAVYAIHENWDSMPGWFHDLWDTITGVFSRAWDFISGIVDKIASAVNFIIDGAKGIASALGFGGGDVEKPKASGGGGGGSAKSSSSSAAKPSASSASSAAASGGAPAAPAAAAVQPYDFNAQNFETTAPPAAAGGGGGGGKKSGGGRKKSGGGGGGGKASAGGGAASAAGTGTTIVTLGGDNNSPVTMYIPAGQSAPASVSGGGSGPSLSPAVRTARATSPVGASRASTKSLGGGASASSSSSGGVTVNLSQDFGIMTSDPSTFRRVMEQLKPDFERLVRRALANISSDRTRTAHAQ